MTVTQLQELFKTQLDTGAKKLFYMTVQGGSEMNQLTASILKHNTEEGTFDDLLASLNGYTYQETVGNASWPRFVKDEQ
jgi:hypothetical protein